MLHTSQSLNYTDRRLTTTTTLSYRLFLKPTYTIEPSFLPPPSLLGILLRHKVTTRNSHTSPSTKQYYCVYFVDLVYRYARVLLYFYPSSTRKKFRTDSIRQLCRCIVFVI